MQARQNNQMSAARSSEQYSQVDEPGQLTDVTDEPSDNQSPSDIDFLKALVTLDLELPFLEGHSVRQIQHAEEARREVIIRLARLAVDAVSRGMEEGSVNASVYEFINQPKAKSARFWLSHRNSAEFAG